MEDQIKIRRSNKNKVLDFMKSLSNLKHEDRVVYSEMLEILYKLEDRIEILEKMKDDWMISRYTLY